MKRKLGLALFFVSALAMNCWALDSLNVSCVGRYFPPNASLQNIAVVDSTEYFLLKDFLLTIDITNPAEQKILSYHYLQSESGKQICFYNDFLALLTATSLRIINPFDPRNPTVVDSFINLNNANFLEKSDNAIIVCTSDGNVLFFNFDRRNRLELITEYNVNEEVVDIEVNNSNMLIGCSSKILSVDISDLDNVSVLDSLNTTCELIEEANGLGFVYADRLIKLVSLADRTNLRILDTLEYDQTMDHMYSTDSLIFFHDDSFVRDDRNGGGWLDGSGVIVVLSPDNILIRRTGNEVIYLYDNEKVYTGRGIYSSRFSDTINYWWQFRLVGLLPYPDNTNSQIVGNRLYKKSLGPQGGTGTGDDKGLQCFDIQDPTNFDFIKLSLFPREDGRHYVYRPSEYWIIDNISRLVYGITEFSHNEWEFTIKRMLIDNQYRISEPVAYVMEGIGDLNQISTYNGRTYFLGTNKLAIFNSLRPNDTGYIDVNLPWGGSIYHVNNTVKYISSGEMCHTYNIEAPNQPVLIDSVQYLNCGNGAKCGDYYYSLGWNNEN